MKTEIEPCRSCRAGWEIEIYDIYSDHPDWRSTGVFFRLEENAQAYADEQNQRLLKQQQAKANQRYREAMARYRDDKALEKAGRPRPRPLVKPKREIVTKFGRWDERYQATPMEWADA